VLRGGLRGGAALCSNTTGLDYFSRFDQIYPSISQYLGTASGGGGVVPFTNVTALWWVPAESGWGLNLIHRSASNIVFGTWYTYGADGKRTWFVMPSGSWSSTNTYSGSLYRTSGPAFTMAYDQALVTTTAVGTGTLTFTDANNGTWSYTVDGVSGVKAIQRFPF
jgi:lysyl endopeptidase